MGITQTVNARDSAKNSSIEYTIYTFQDCDKPSSGSEKWQRQDSLTDMTLAVKKAESLFKTGDYCKVEIKQKFSDLKNNRVIDTTFKVYKRQSKKSLSTRMAVMMCAVAGVMAFAATYFIGAR